MNPQASIISFSNPKAFTGLTGKVDLDNAVIHGVALLQGEMAAEGHNLFCDSVLVKQLHSLGTEKGRVPCNLDHGSGISATCGYIDGFRIDGKTLRGDLHLLKTHEETPTLLERAETMSDCFGLSASFQGPPKGILYLGRKCARADKLLSFDIVCRPAAVANGLFSAKENKVTLQTINDNIIRLSKGEPIESELTPTTNINDAESEAEKQFKQNIMNQPQKVTLDQVLEAVNALTEQVGTLQQSHQELAQQNAALTEAFQNGNPGNPSENADYEQLKAFYEASDEDLAAYNQAKGTNITRDQINAEVQNWNASVEAAGGEELGNQGEQGGEQGGGEAAMAGAGVETGAAAGTALSAIAREVIQLKAQIKAREDQENAERENIQFEAVAHNFDVIAQERDRLVQLSEQLVAENEALHLYVKTGTRPAKGQTNNGTRMFSANQEGELHEFQTLMLYMKEANPKLTDAQALMLCSRENPALHQDWIGFMARNRTIHA